MTLEGKTLLQLTLLFLWAYSSSSEVMLQPEAMVDEDTIIVQRSLKYCTDRVMDHQCNFSTVDKHVVVPTGYDLPSPYLNLVILNAQQLTLYPSCVVWIDVINASYVRTSPAKGEDIHSCRSWLRLHNSNASVIESGVKDLSVVDSYVSSINLTDQRDFSMSNSYIHSIKRLSWEGYEGRIQDSHIEYLNLFETSENFIFKNTTIQYMDKPNSLTINAKTAEISNCRIGEVSYHSFVLNTGITKLTNVAIHNIESKGIVLKNDAVLMMTNVTIDKAAEQFVQISEFSMCVFSNVTVANESIEFHRPGFLTEYSDSEDEIEVLVDDVDHCQYMFEELHCDYSDTLKVVSLDGKKLQSSSPEKTKLFLNNIKFLKTGMLCGLEITLTNISHSAVFKNTTDTKECSHTTSLNIYNSNLTKSLDFKFLETLTITNSKLFKINLSSPLHNLEITNSNVGIMEHVIMSPNSVAKIKDSEIKFMHNMTVLGSLEFISSHFSKIRRLTIDSENKELSVFNSSYLSKGKENSILVKRGKIAIDSATLTNMMLSNNHTIFYLEEEAFLNLDLSRAFFIMFFDLNNYLISVANKSQILVEDEAAGAVVPMFVKVRRKVTDMNNMTNVRLVPSDEICEEKLEFQHTFLRSWSCDFTDFENVVVETETFPNRPVYEIIGASELHLYRSCAHKVVINKCNNVSTVEDPESSCHFWLEAKHSNILSLTENLLDVTLVNCTVDLISLQAELRDIDIQSSTVKAIDGLRWTGYHGIFQDSKFSSIKNMLIFDGWRMSACTVEVIHKNGINISSEAKISSTNISKIEKDAVFVEVGTLLIENVVIDTIEDYAFSIGLLGKLELVNVTIKHGNPTFLNINESGRMTFVNVSLGGYQLKRTVKLTLIKPTSDPFTTPSDKKVTTIAPSPSKTSHVTTSNAHTNAEALIPLNSEVASSKEKKPKSSWATLTIGFVVGFIVGLIGLILLITIRNKRVRPSRRIRWRVPEDRNDLLDEEELQSSSLADLNQISDDHYTRVPGHL